MLIVPCSREAGRAPGQIRHPRPCAIFDALSGCGKMNNLDNILHQERCMDLSDLRIFSAVGRQGGVTPAAQRLHPVHSTVTTRDPRPQPPLPASPFPPPRKPPPPPP